MSLKAGRVGVAPDQVDLFGNIIAGGSGGDAYTKAESDAKFETISNAVSTYETKSDAAALQPKTLSVPITMLDGSKTTVEGMLSSLDEEELAYTDLIEGATVDSSVGNHLYRIGRLVISEFALNSVTAATPFSTVVAKVPAALKPKSNIFNTIGSNTAIINTAGELVFTTALSNATVRIMCMWVI